MAYRDSIDALQQRHDALARELAASREQTKNLDEHRAKQSHLEAELVEVAAKLGVMRDRRPALPLLDNVAIASPCNADWNKMQGDDRVRFCGDCKKNVYNLSAMNGRDAEALLAQREGNLCVRLYKRTDGTVLTADCSVGVKKKLRRKIAFGIAGAGAMAFATASRLHAPMQTQGAITPIATTDVVSVQGGLQAMPTPVPNDETEMKMGDVGPLTMMAPPPHPMIMGRIAPPKEHKVDAPTQAKPHPFTDAAKRNENRD